MGPVDGIYTYKAVKRHYRTKIYEIEETEESIRCMYQMIRVDGEDGEEGMERKGTNMNV